MFDFENLIVYKKSKLLNKDLYPLLNQSKLLDPITRDQLKRALLSITLNIAEGTGKFTKGDKRYFYTTAKGSAYECVAILDTLTDQGIITQQEYQILYLKLEEISKMLTSLINSLSH